MNHHIVCGDALTELRCLESSSADCVLSSPPYNIGKPYEHRTDMERYVAWIEPICAEAVRVLRVGGSFIWQVGTHVTGSRNPREKELLPLDFVFIPLLLRLGLAFRDRYIWAFNHGLHCKYRFSGRHETVLWFTKGEPFWSVAATRDRLAGADGVWTITNVKNNHREKTSHPCQFPEILVERCLTNLTGRGDTVLDPFAGSGTVSAVAARIGRKSISIELDPNYAEVARRRVAAVTRTLGVAA